MGEIVRQGLAHGKRPGTDNYMVTSRVIRQTVGIAVLETDKLFAGSIPENYDRYMVPLIFEPFAADIARRAAALSPAAVLEIAAGSGVVARVLAPRLARDASYTITDLNQPMVDYAASRQPADS